MLRGCNCHWLMQPFTIGMAEACRSMAGRYPHAVLTAAALLIGISAATTNSAKTMCSQMATWHRVQQTAQHRGLRWCLRIWHCIARQETSAGAVCISAALCDIYRTAETYLGNLWPSLYSCIRIVSFASSIERASAQGAADPVYLDGMGWLASYALARPRA